MKKDDTLNIAKRVIAIEADAVKALADRLDGAFSDAVEMILSATGKVVVTGMGKSGLICQKIAATLASTGTSSFFLHPAEGAHGDLGMLMKNDILIAVSNSGETAEIIRMIPVVKRLGIKLIAMTGDPASTLSKEADVSLDVSVAEEACPLGLAPTASTTATLAMGDALAVALLDRRGFREEDFAGLHPAGSLGRKLLKVADMMHTGSEVPLVDMATPMKEAVKEMTSKKLGITGVLEGDVFKGVITDGDLRRALEKGDQILDKTAGEVMSGGPKTVTASAIAESALKLMEEHSITSLFVCEDECPEKVAGIVHLHDLIRAGVI